MIDRLSCRETEMRRLCEKVIFKLAQLALPVLFARGLEVPRAHERSDAPAGLDNAGSLQLGVNFRDRISIDAQINRKLTHRRQLIPYRELFRCDGESNRPVQLMMQRRGMRCIDVE